MASLNKVLLIGNITRDPEQRFTPAGTAVCQFGLAVNSNYKTANGEKREEVTFFDLEAWGKLSEVIATHCKKGKSIYIEARAKTETWDDKTTGQKRSKMKFIVENFQFLGSKGDGEATERPAQQQTRKPPASPPRPPADPDLDAADDDIPFNSVDAHHPKNTRLKNPFVFKPRTPDPDRQELPF